MKYFKYILGILIVVSLFSCAKESVISEADFQKNLLAGTGNYQNTEHIWRLDSLTIGNNPVALTAIQKKYTKTFSRTGAYIDSDGFSGKWDMSTPGKLEVTTQNSVTNVKTTTLFDITTLNAAQLQLKLSGSLGVYQYYFVIAN
ncbi:MAG: hypothetical protein RLZ56_941 [Bacteroidota bacterium]|jgi:hypothetical protein